MLSKEKEDNKIKASSDKKKVLKINKKLRIDRTKCNYWSWLLYTFGQKKCLLYIYHL